MKVENIKGELKMGRIKEED